jgi:tetraacyldisaccharide-1-P 4'-kinase
MVLPPKNPTPNSTSKWQSRRQHLRRILEAPWAQKPWWFWPLSPLLFLVAACVAHIAQHRRRWGYASVPFHPKIFVVCVGNVLMGGSGKSPIAQNLARQAFHRYDVVGMSVRGVGKDTSKMIMVSSWQDPALSTAPPATISDLGDEAREHLWYLSTTAPPQKKYVVVQGAKRKEALKAFMKFVGPNQQGYFILDDGLQHFSCPRHMNICVWNPEIVSTSPPYPFPVGPYREGWGVRGLRAFFKTSSGLNHVWSRALVGEEAEFHKKVKEAREYLGLKTTAGRGAKKVPLNLGLEITATLEFYQVEDSQGKKIFPSLKHIPRTEIQNFLNNPAQNTLASATPFSVGVLCGIGRPQAFLQNLQDLFPHQTFSLCAVDDHGPLTPQAREFLSTHSVIVTTLKDFLRWQEEGPFYGASTTLYVARLEVGGLL